MTKNINELEDQLHALGRQELSLERQLQDLRVEGRSAASVGDTERADLAWKLFEATRLRLCETQKKIAQVEVRLYTLRRRQRS